MMVWHFPPKKAVAGDCPGSVIRPPKATRPIACKVCDNKVVAATICHSISEMTKAQTSSIQRGFVPLRQISQNVLEIDVVARVHAIRCLDSRNQNNLSSMLPAQSVADIASICLFDFESAFPSVIHGWVFWSLSI